MLHQVSKTKKKKKKVQGHGFKGLECELFLKSIQAAMWSHLFAPVMTRTAVFCRLRTDESTYNFLQD